jgi:CxxC motif-containing protein (DUF1111 family)
MLNSLKPPYPIHRYCYQAVHGLLLCLAFGGCSGGGGDSGSELAEDRSLQGGDTTTDDRTGLSFEQPAPNLSGESVARHAEGDASFAAVFVTPPALFNAGLGPQFNNSSCDGCHTKNGRGQPIFGTGGLGSQAVVKISSPNGEPEARGGAGIVPGFGTQLQDHAVFGTAAEVSIQLNYETIEGTYGDGSPYMLRKPKLSIQTTNGRNLPADTQYSFRTPPPVFGVGLLEAVPADAILANADPEDSNGDGISGRVNMVYNALDGLTAVGRFGRKANNPNLIVQSAGAYHNDMGVSNSIFKDPGETPEVDEATLKSVEFYVQTIAVPRAGSIDDPNVAAGEALFRSSGCASCHIQRFVTGDHPVVELAHQTIFPYSDMLIHDMGPGLADGRPDFQANGNEWRTPPLWGIGITATILSSTQNYLHDGRARTVEEAILWHGGEAETAKEKFRNMSRNERDQLIAFIRSL